MSLQLTALLKIMNGGHFINFNLDYKHYQHLFIFLNNSWKTLINSILFALIRVSIPLSENFPVNVNYWLMEN